jgi:hypothetical protein
MIEKLVFGVQLCAEYNQVWVLHGAINSDVVRLSQSLFFSQLNYE